MERDCESELSKLNIEQNACIYHFGASVIHGQRSNILRLHCSDRKNIIYGRNMKDGSMFRVLKNYQDIDFFRNTWIWRFTCRVEGL